MAAATTAVASVKVIGANGQISLGKKFAGRQVVVEEREPGVWLIRTATVIPDNERWLHEPKALRDLEKAFAWEQANPANGSNAAELLDKWNEEFR